MRETPLEFEMTKILTAFFREKRYQIFAYTHIWSLVSHVLCYFLYADLHKVSFPPPDFFFILMLNYIICTKHEQIWIAESPFG